MDSSLFPNKSSVNPPQDAPLPYRMRPRTLEEFIGQSHILGQGKALRRLILSDRLSSAIFFGPPGCGKTALASLIASITKKDFSELNAITATITEIRTFIKNVHWKQTRTGRKSILFVDEISHFNKLQQDALMPEIEKGTFILIGATTENPFFSINRALLSRSQIFEFKALADSEIEEIIRYAISDSERGLGSFPTTIEPSALHAIIHSAEGDGRKALHILETAWILAKESGKDSYSITEKIVSNLSITKTIGYGEDTHYDVISAFIKSIRGSNPDAALYWLAVMILAGENPRFIARRIVIAAAEDIGNADPAALYLAVATFQAVEFLGMPEAKIPLAQATVYLAAAPKSNASYQAIQNAIDAVSQERVEEVPPHLQEAGYKGAKTLNRGNHYLYPHNDPDGVVAQQYLGKKKKFYFPTNRGYEKKIEQFLQQVQDLEKKKENNETGN
jgi:putative ATPase